MWAPYLQAKCSNLCKGLVTIPTIIKVYISVSIPPLKNLLLQRSLDFGRSCVVFPRIQLEDESEKTRRIRREALLAGYMIFSHIHIYISVGVSCFGKTPERVFLLPFCVFKPSKTRFSTPRPATAGPPPRGG